MASLASTETPEVSQGPRLLVPRTGTARAFSGGFGTGGIWTLLEKAIPREGEVGWGLRVRGWREAGVSGPGCRAAGCSELGCHEELC